MRGAAEESQCRYYRASTIAFGNFGRSQLSSGCRARSTADWINKLGVVIEEADESGYWLELIVESKLMSESKVSALLKEANELVAIFTASQMTSRRIVKK